MQNANGISKRFNHSNKNCRKAWQKAGAIKATLPLIQSTSTVVNGRPTSDDHARAVAEKVRANLKKQGRDQTVTIAPSKTKRVQENISREPRTARERDDMIDKIRRMMTQDRNPANLQIMKKDIEILQTKYRDLKEDSDGGEAVEMAIIKRVLVAHTDLIMDYGLDKVTQAIEEVAYNVGDVDEIGTSDVWLGPPSPADTRCRRMRFQEIQEACWKGYRQAGMKKKGDRQVPNCVPVNEVEIGPEITANQLLYKAAAMAMRDAGREGITLDYDQAIKQASRIYGIPYQPSELPKLLAQRQEIDRQLALLKQGKQVAKQRRQAKRAPTPAGAEEYWKTHALPTDRIKPATKTLEQTETELAEDLKKWFKEKWVRFGPDGKIRGDCARGSSKEGKPKCLPQSKAHALGKAGRASAASKKRREDPNPERRGPAKNVATKVDRLGRRAGAVPGSNIDQVTNAYQQKILDRMGKRFGLPPGATIAQVQAAQQAYLNKNDPRAAAQYRQNMANIEAGKTAQNKPVQLEPRYPTSMAEDARSESEQQHGWRAELVDEISPITFEVRLTNRRSRESANFVVRPADLIRIRL
jgi:hypothetical protein